MSGSRLTLGSERLRARANGVAGASVVGFFVVGMVSGTLDVVVVVTGTSVVEVSALS